MKVIRNDVGGVQDKVNVNQLGKTKPKETLEQIREKQGYDSTKVSISDKGKTFSMIKKKVDASPDVREDKIAHYKKLIESGQYKVDPEKVAEAMIKETIKNEVL